VVDHLEVIVDEAVGLRLQSDDEDGLDSEDSDDDDDDMDLEGKLPTFRRLRTGSIVLNYPVPNLPLPSQINPMDITVLTITEMGLGPPNPIRLLRFLTAFPEIETLTFDGHALEPDYDEDDVPPVVTLPKLHELTVGKHMFHSNDPLASRRPRTDEVIPPTPQHRRRSS
jgi:hypothetical protein